jgi:hypothetical protein
MTTEKKQTGRPRLYSEELAAKVCTSIAEGRSLKKTCEGEGMPSMLTVFKWLQDGELKAFHANYARARDEQVAKFADELQDIADDASNDFSVDEDGNEIVNHEHIQRSKLRIDTRKWILAKMMPKKYGDRAAVELSGPDGKPIQQEVILPQLGADEIRKVLAAAGDPVYAVNGVNGNGRH